MNGAASATKLASPAPTSARDANANPYVGASAHPSSPTAHALSPTAISRSGFALFAIALNIGAPASRPIMNAAFSAPYAAYEHPSAPCSPRPAGSRALLGAPLTAAELAIPRSDVHQRADEHEEPQERARRSRRRRASSTSSSDGDSRALIARAIRAFSSSRARRDAESSGRATRRGARRSRPRAGLARLTAYARAGSMRGDVMRRAALSRASRVMAYAMLDARALGDWNANTARAATTAYASRDALDATESFFDGFSWQREGRFGLSYDVARRAFAVFRERDDESIGVTRVRTGERAYDAAISPNEDVFAATERDAPTTTRRADGDGEIVASYVSVDRRSDEPRSACGVGYVCGGRCWRAAWMGRWMCST